MQHPDQDDVYTILNDDGKSASNAEVDFSELLRMLNPAQLVVVDELVNARADAARELAQLTSVMQHAMAVGDFAACRSANEKAADSVARCNAYTVAIRAALNAFTRARNGKVQG